MQVLVTGATGQLGSEVARTLVQRGDRVRCLLRDPARARLLDGVDVERVRGDITEADSLGPAVQGCEAVLHLAGIVSYLPRNRAVLQAVNVDGTRNLVEAAVAAGVRRLLLTSSIAALGHVVGEGEAEGDEDTPFNWEPEGIAYMETKKAAEDLVLGERRLEGLAVNPGIVFGPRDLQQNGGRMVLQVLRRQVPFAPSGGTTAANLEDVAAGHLLALDKGVAGRRYILGGTTGSFLSLYGRIAAAVGGPAPTRVAPPALVSLIGALQELSAALSGREPPVTRQIARVSARNRRYRSLRAEAELGYSPRPLERGIRACADWYRSEGVLP